MVYYFESRGASGTIDPPRYIYMGKHKEENEELIKYGWEEDLWFHVDNYSSAHVYLRLLDGETWDDVPREIIEDCAQLTKANSIEGNKKDNITVIYTPWSNLRKTNGMVAGQVGFKNNKQVRRIKIETRINAIINRLNKTRKEEFPDLRAQRLDHEREKDRKLKAEQEKKAKNELAEAEKKKNMQYAKQHAYDDLFTDENVRCSSNQFRNEDFEDDFW